MIKHRIVADILVFHYYPKQFLSPTFQKLIVGHKGAMNITEKVYTHIDMKLLVDAINSMYYPEHLKLSD